MCVTGSRPALRLSLEYLWGTGPQRPGAWGQAHSEVHLIEHRALLIEHGVFGIECRALLIEYLALLIDYRALLIECMTLLIDNGLF